MAQADPKIVAEMDRLIAEMNDCISRGGYSGNRWQRFPVQHEFDLLRIQATNLILKVCGRDSAHYEALNSIPENHQPYTLPSYLGALGAARQAYVSGLLADLRILVAAEILTEFTDQAEDLLRNQYVVAAASILGAVLEDSLRKLSDKHGVKYPAKTKLESLNVELCKAGVYAVQIQKRITHLGDIRNSADHGHFDAVKKDDVEDMLKFLRRFAADYL